MESLRALALELGLPERTVRRAASEGLIRGERVGPRKWTTSVRERDYLRRHWSFLVALRAALRTEPNVRLAILYGSHAVGAAGPKSDIDLLVELRNDDVSRLAELSGRLASAMGQDVQPVRLSDARKKRSLLADILREGRVLVDRDEQWWTLKRREGQLAETRAETELEDAIAALELGDDTQ